MIKQKAEIWVKCSNIVAILSVVLVLLSCGDDSGVTITGDDIHTPVEVRLVHGTLLVANTLVNNTINLDMLVDTGSFKTYVPAEIFGNLNGEVYIANLCLENGVCFNNFLANSSDSAFTQSKEGYFNGIIGIDLLSHFDVTFDYKNELMILYDTLQTDSSDRVILPFDYNAFVPYATVSIEGLSQGTHLLDTGAAFTRITPAVLASLSQEPEVLFTSVVFTLGIPENVEYMMLTDYCAGTACPGDIIVQIGSWPAVGGTFFREYLTTFMFSENVVKLEPYSDRSHIKESGIQRMGLQINIYDASDIIYVMEGGFAWEGGLREGDEILSVNEVPIDALGYFGIYELLADTSINEYQFLVRTPEGDVGDVSVTTE